MGKLVRAATGATGLFSSTTKYVAVGPFGEGALLRRVRVGWAIAGAGSLAIALVLSSSDEETQATLKAGRTLLTRSLASVAGVPAASFQSSADNGGSFDVFWGLPLSGAERYVLLGSSMTGAAFGAVVLSAELFAVGGADRT